MKVKSGKHIYYLYFKDFFEWLLAMTFVFVCVFAIGTVKNNWIMSLIIAFACWLVVVLIPLKMIIFCVNVYKEISKDYSLQKLITIHKISYDKSFSLRGRGGGIVGSPKLIIEDNEGNLYRIFLKQGARNTKLNELVGKMLLITYLPKSGFVTKITLSFENGTGKETKKLCEVA